MKSIAIRRPNNSPAIRVNLLMMEQAPRMANRNSKRAVHMHTLPIKSHVSLPNINKKIKEEQNSKIMNHILGQTLRGKRKIPSSPG